MLLNYLARKYYERSLNKSSQSIVMMTAHGDAKKAGNLIISGAIDFIAKPFRAEQLRHVCSIAAHRRKFYY